MRMQCDWCGSKFEKPLVLKIHGAVTSTRIVCPICKEPGPTFIEEEHPDYEPGYPIE